MPRSVHQVAHGIGRFGGPQMQQRLLGRVRRNGERLFKVAQRLPMRVECAGPIGCGLQGDPSLRGQSIGLLAGP